ncbi:hypothetical protein AU468_09805 [Alkalispirochaeta sphaeroplastigenens]|uniref:Uncharacterized protein n=1 Tax=Alkalispirochaeta sphaeroplastigenens TaxID=1187066 RepID=A0A2S4JL82_9SPIO|nr:hypothetical protein [Alkalispirochaeta sphaeroplastigenens]POR00261.1 hypothetical protein AU468_09805 [Alkalispirochaeta sphaeroplastigenens]
MQAKQKDLNRLEADIAVIKEAIRANNGFIRHVLAAQALGRFMLAFGVGCIFVSLAWYIALERYGALNAVPLVTTVVLAGFSVAVLVVLGLWKTASITRAARNLDSRYSWHEVVGDLTGHPILFSQGLVVVTTVFVSVIAGRSGNVYLVPAAVAAGFATVFLLYAVAFLLTEYIPITIWLYLVAMITILLPGVSPMLIVAGGFGAGFVVYGLYCNAIGRSTNDRGVSES